VSFVSKIFISGEPTMKKNLIALLIIISMPLFACSITFNSPQTIRGSGVLASESRPVSGFDAIELVGSADVNVSFGETESVVVEAEDNILPLIETRVRGGRLVINWKPNTSVSATKPVLVTVTMKSLEAASIPGSGSITIAGMNAGKVKFDLRGSGNITADGTADSVDVSFGGSGNILCGDLQARSARVKLTGSGNVEVFASESLDVTLNGSGSVTYSGNPAQVHKSVPGSGSIEPAR
jgi:hypothetical protein